MLRSLEIVARGLHQADKGILQTWFDLLPRVRFLLKRADGSLDRGGLASAHVELVSKGGDLLDAREILKLLRKTAEVRAGNFPGRQLGGGEHILKRPLGEQLSVGDIGEAMAALGFVHVMRGDEHGQALRGQAMDFFPEIAARLRIDACCRFVEKEEFRPVDKAGGERETLFPPAGKLPGELGFASFKPKTLQHLRYRLGGVRHFVDVGDEAQIFGQREILVEAEPLGHVADPPLDRVALPNNIVAEAGAAP